MNDTELKQAVEEQLSNARTIGMKIGAEMISAAVFGVINKNIYKTDKPSLRDYKRAIKGIEDIISVQLQSKEMKS